MALATARPGRPTPRRRGALAVCLCAIALLAACGQKGPLFLPAATGAAASPAHAPSAPDDRVPPSPVAPMPSDSPPPALSGVAPKK